MSDIKCTWWVKTDKPVVWEGPLGSPVYRCLETGEELPSRRLPVGALRIVEDAKDWGMPLGPDGHHVICRMPCGGDWHIDGRATNCTLPNDNEHRCWVRHGSIGDALHIDKNGLTCSAGAGSIQYKDYHGFLHHGTLRSC